MTEQELRLLVRDAIARHSGAAALSAPPHLGPSAPSHPRTFAPSSHLSHALFTLATGADVDGSCVIEPAVTCNHCGYCKSYGH